jgi:hypothetical protein
VKTPKIAEKSMQISFHGNSENSLYIYSYHLPNKFTSYFPHFSSKFFFHLSAFELKSVILLYGKIMLENEKKHQISLVMETLGKIIQFFSFWLVWRRGGVIEFTSGKFRVENEYGWKNYGVENFHDPHILDKKSNRLIKISNLKLSQSKKKYLTKKSKKDSNFI